MTLDEAIRHCEEVAECNEIAGLESEARRQCCNDHRQLAEWLTELKEAKAIIRVCNRVLGFLLECEIEIYLTPEQYNRFILLYRSDQLSRWG